MEHFVAACLDSDADITVVKNVLPEHDMLFVTRSRSADDRNEQRTLRHYSQYDRAPVRDGHVDSKSCSVLFICMLSGVTRDN